ncbi:LOW QUALITY PROTEIN: V-type proton ATPase subunit F [Drosophila sulfurigaster albostrigata]|uniref:LOW QUALITY PROTEIN: V-type proton ATPase subunit F n=1 Tax=Drosophila sulfurigaster albostrigata TaxID=89887 RepID=UPI002D219629|nr:LOW QUALITY PROTEIN: V-type proton ATPase subunit F [Drosophila sulfurigaster albostrigata]
MSTFTNNPLNKPLIEDVKEEEDHLEKPEETNVIRIGVIADTEVALGLLLVGIGYHHQKFRNYLMVENDTSLAEIEEFFHKLYKRPNIGIILLDYPTAKRLSPVLEKCKKLLPVVVILPTKASIVSYMEEKERLRRQRQREAYN